MSLWLVSAGIGCLFFVFRGLATWGVVWLVEARGLTPVQATSSYVLQGQFNAHQRNHSLVIFSRLPAEFACH